VQARGNSIDECRGRVSGHGTVTLGNPAVSVDIPVLDVARFYLVDFVYGRLPDFRIGLVDPVGNKTVKVTDRISFGGPGYSIEDVVSFPDQMQYLVVDGGDVSAHGKGQIVIQTLRPGSGKFQSLIGNGAFIRQSGTGAQGARHNGHDVLGLLVIPGCLHRKAILESLQFKSGFPGIHTFPMQIWIGNVLGFIGGDQLIAEYRRIPGNQYRIGGVTVLISRVLLAQYAPGTFYLTVINGALRALVILFANDPGSPHGSEVLPAVRIVGQKARTAVASVRYVQQVFVLIIIQHPRKEGKRGSFPARSASGLCIAGPDIHIPEPGIVGNGV